MFRSVPKGVLSSISFTQLAGRLPSVNRTLLGIVHRSSLITQSSSTYPINGTALLARLSSTDSTKASTTPKEKAKPSEPSKSSKPSEKKKKGSPRPQKKRSQAELRTHLEAFFAQPEYAGFKYDPTKPYMEEFYRMTNFFGWNSKGTEAQQEKFKAAREGINRASVLQFNEIFGKDEKDVAAWRNLCSVLDIAKIPKGRSKCMKLVKSLYINICDLVDSRALDKKVEHFDSEEKLSLYTNRTGKFFPLEDAHAGGLLRFLLRKILHPPKGASPYPRPVLRK